MKINLRSIKSILAILGAFILCGCSSLSYIGDDYTKENASGVTTEELAFFNTYKKDIAQDVTLKIGITKTQSNESSVMYIGVVNNSDYPYTLYADDFQIYADDLLLDKVSVNKFAENFYNEQNELLMASQAIAPSINSITTIMNSYQGDHQKNVTKAENNTNAAINKLQTTIATIKLHSLSKSATVDKNSSQYYYIYFEGTERYPIEVKYKDLIWTFGNKTR